MMDIMRGLQSVKDVMGLKKAVGAVTDTDEEAANDLANCFCSQRTME